MLVDVRFRVLHRNRPLLIPPVRLRKHAAIHHCEPIVTPQVHIYLRPVAVVLDLLRIEHQRAIHSGACDVGFQSGFADDRAIAFRQRLAQLAHVRVIFARQHFAECCQSCRHRDAVGVVCAAVKNLVVGDQAHRFAACAECAQWQPAAN